MVQLNIEIGDEQKKDWKEAVAKNPEYNSLTHLVTLSVMRELDRDPDAGGAGDAGSVEDIMTIMDSLTDLSDDISELHTDIKDVQVTVNHLNDRERIRNDIMEVLRNSPEVDGFKSGSEFWDEDEDGENNVLDEESAVGPMRPDEIAVELGEPIQTVERELEWLFDNYPHVERFRVGDSDGVWYTRTDDQEIDSITDEITREDVPDDDGSDEEDEG